MTSEEHQCAGEQTHTQAEDAPFLTLGTGIMLDEGDISCQDDAEQPEHKFQPNDQSSFELSLQQPGPASIAHGQPYLSIKGGAPSSSVSYTATQRPTPMTMPQPRISFCKTSQ